MAYGFRHRADFADSRTDCNADCALAHRPALRRRGRPGRWLMTNGETYSNAATQFG